MGNHRLSALLLKTFFGESLHLRHLTSITNFIYSMNNVLVLRVVSVTTVSRKSVQTAGSLEKKLTLVRGAEAVQVFESS